MRERPINVILFGPSGSGKTLYVQQILNQEKESNLYSTTIGLKLETISTLLNGHEKTVHLREIGGSFLENNPKTGNELLKAHLKSADLILVFCDLSDPKGLEKIEQQYTPEILKKFCENPNAQFVLMSMPIVNRKNFIFEDYPIFSNFCDKHEFNDSRFMTQSSQKESQKSFEKVLQSAIDARKKALIEKLKSYHQKRSAHEGLKTFAACVAWLLGLSCLFGHSKKSDKLAAASVLLNALQSGNGLLGLEKPSQQKALKGDRLGRLYQEARSFVKEPSPPTAPVARKKS